MQKYQFRAHIQVLLQPKQKKGVGFFILFFNEKLEEESIY